MKKSLKAILAVASIAVILWIAVFITDYAMVSSFKEPIFVVADGATADDGGSGTFKGLGYTVEVEKELDANNGARLVSVEMKMFNKIIAAAIA